MVYLIFTTARLDIRGLQSDGARPDCGPLAEDSATKLKRDQLNVCTVYVCVWCTLFLPAAEICARLAGNFCQ